MLYDKRWDAKVETKDDLFSLNSLIAWIEKQPADTEYCYLYSGECLVAQYLQANGVERHALDPVELKALGWNDIAQGDPDTPKEVRWTFGAALERARALTPR